MGQRMAEWSLKHSIPPLKLQEPPVHTVMTGRRDGSASTVKQHNHQLGQGNGKKWQEMGIFSSLKKKGCGGGVEKKCHQIYIFSPLSSPRSMSAMPPLEFK